MFKKLIAAVAATAILLTGTMTLGGAKTSGVISSHKNLLSLQYVMIDGKAEKFVMIEDTLRVKERVKNSQSRVPPIVVTGRLMETGDYFIVLQFGFMHMRVGPMPWSKIVKNIPGMALIQEVRPAVFQTFDGFEDIWVYMDTTPEQEARVLQIIRDLDRKAAEAEGVR